MDPDGAEPMLKTLDPPVGTVSGWPVSWLGEPTLDQRLLLVGPPSEAYSFQVVPS